MSDLDARLTNQLGLLRALHNMACPLLAMLRETLLKQQLEHERLNQPPSLAISESLKHLDQWNQLSEKVVQIQRPWS